MRLHRTVGILSEEQGESLHNSINKQLRQYQSVRDQGKKLQLVVTSKELLNQADGTLLLPVPRKKRCDSYKSLKTNHECETCKKQSNNPT